jgi:hypothetical protein
MEPLEVWTWVMTGEGSLHKFLVFPERNRTPAQWPYTSIYSFYGIFSQPSLEGELSFSRCIVLGYPVDSMNEYGDILGLIYNSKNGIPMEMGPKPLNPD